MMPASFSHGSEIATTVSCCLACRFAMPLSLATSLSTAALTALLWGSFTSLALAIWVGEIKVTVGRAHHSRPPKVGTAALGAPEHR